MALRALYLFDISRGVELLRLRGEADASSAMRAVAAPAVGRDRLAPPGVGDAGLVCPLFTLASARQ